MQSHGSEFRNPVPTVDVIIEVEGGGIVLIERRNAPHGWAIPGGFVDEGEPLWAAARREAKEETGLDVELTEQFHTYSDPRRDPRRHTVATVFLGRAAGAPQASDDAAGAGVFTEATLPSRAPAPTAEAPAAAEADATEADTEEQES